MEFHQLRDFLAVAATGSFSKAAKKCHVAQPSLSKAIQRLEDEFGEKLFVRLKRQAVLTPAGEIVQRRATRILNEVEQAKRDLEDARGLRRGKVNIGILPTISPYFLPRVLAQFTQKFPALQVVVTEETTVDLLKLVETWELDLALVSLPIPDTNLETETLFQEELLLAVPSKHSLAVKPSVSVKDLDGEKFILMKEGHCLADQVLTFCHEKDLRLQIVLKTSQIETVHSLVMAGMGISLVPQMARISGRIPLVYRSLENPKPTRSVTAVWRNGHDHTRAAAEFLNQLRQSAKAFVETLEK
jgi:LysR family hydrogen peroxide-inducible transcriptional activator